MSVGLKVINSKRQQQTIHGLFAMKNKSFASYFLNFALSINILIKFLSFLGFVCRLCSNIERNVIHLYTDEGLQKKLEQKINVYLKINLSRSDPLPKVICVPCELKLEQHHRFIQRVIQNQKKIQGNRPIIPLLEQHLRVRVTAGNGSDSNSYNIEPVTSDESSDSSDDDDEAVPASNNFMDTSSSSLTPSSSSSSSSQSSSSSDSAAIEAAEHEDFHDGDEHVQLEQRIQESLADDSENRHIILIDDEAQNDDADV